METDQPTLNWKAAHKHLLDTMCHYFDCMDMPGVEVRFALQLTFFPLINRYVSGERTQTLYEEMRDVQ